MRATSTRARHRASLAASLALVWIALVAWRAVDVITTQRYVALGYTHLASLAVRDVVLGALPLLLVGVPLAVAIGRLSRRPRALAALVVALPLAVAYVLAFPSINETLRDRLPAREARALVLGALALVVPVIGLGVAALSGRSAVARRRFERAARRFDTLAVHLRTHMLTRMVATPAVTALAVVIAAIAVLLPRATGPEPPPGPPIVVILIDTLRADHLGVYGYTRETSPHIDAWAGGATVFDRAIAQASWTKPSVASLFTSLHPSVHRTGSGTHLRREVAAGELRTVPAPPNAPRSTGTLPDELVTLAEPLRNAGYRTAGFVANGLLGETDGYAQGFGRYEILDDRRLTSAAIDFVAAHADEPFFLYLHYMAPHAPYDPPAAFDRFGRVPGGEDDRFDLLRTATKDSINFSRTLVPTESEIRDLIDQYDGEIAFADELVESVLSALEIHGLADRAVVVLTADHGEAFMEHGMVWHESVQLYDELTRIPLIVRAPGTSTAARIADPVMHVDLAPTLLALAGVGAPDEMQGISLVPVLEGSAQPVRNAYAETIDWGDKQATWGETLKLIVDHEDARLELYDLAVDPGERIDIADRELEGRAALLDSVRARRAANRAHGTILDVELGALTEEQLERLRSLGYVQ